MELNSVLYVSENYIDFPKKAYVVEDIVRLSKSWNRSVSITGALAFTESHFSQYIEGLDKSVSDLVVKLLGDKMHSCIDIITIAPVSNRSFDDWSLAISGPEPFTCSYLQPLIDRNPEDLAANNKLAENWLSFFRELSSSKQTHI